MAETRQKKTPSRKAPAKKPEPQVVKHMNVFAVPVVEIDVTARCSHGCYLMIPTSCIVFNFQGIGNRIDVGPGGDQSDILIHQHTGSDFPENGEDTCESECWNIFEDDE
jgi:hypothetical protein